MPTNTADDPETPITEGAGIGLPEKASRYSRTVQNADGSFTLEYSPIPMNYKDDSGQWQEIDNTLVESPGAAYAAENAANEFEVKIPENPATTPVSFEHDGDWVSMLSVGADAEAPEVSESEATFEVADAEVAYAVTNSGLKETIALDAPPTTPASFQYVLKTSVGLTPTLTAEQQIDFVDAAGDIAFSIPRGFMTDSAPDGGVTSDAVTYSLSSSGASWRLTLTPDAAWLADPDRVYPVNIDPTVDYGARKSCWLQENAPTTSRCAGDYVKVGKQDGYRRRGLIDLNINNIPAEATVTNAQLFMWLDSNATTGGGGEANYVWYRNGPWTQSATWSNNGAGQGWGGGSPGDYASNQISLIGGGWAWWDLRGTTSNWRSGAWAQDGLLLAQLPEKTETTLGFISDSNQLPQFRPIYRVEYTMPPYAPYGSEINPWYQGDLTGATPTISTWAADYDGSNVRGDTYVYDSNGNYAYGVQTGFVGSGGVVSAQVPRGTLQRGGVYYTLTYPYDGTGYGNPSPAVWFRVATCDELPSDCAASPVVGDQTSTQRFITLQGNTSNGSWVKYQYRVGKTAAFQDIAKENLATEDGTRPAGIPFESAGGSYPRHAWDLRAQLGSTTKAVVQVRACYGDSQDNLAESRCSNPGTVTYAPGDFGLSKAVETVGPGQVSLVTGDFKMSATDAVLSAPLGSLSAGRATATLTPAAGAEKPSTGVFGPGWIASFAGPDSGLGEMTIDVQRESGYVYFNSPEGYKLAFLAQGDVNSFPLRMNPVEDAAATGLSVTMPDASTVRLVDTAGTTTEWSLQSGRWQVRSVREANARTATTYSHDSAGRVTRILAPPTDGVTCSEADADTQVGCRSLVFTYGTVGTSSVTRLLKMSLSLPKVAGTVRLVEVARYGYDTAGRLTSAWDPRVTPNLKTTYTYDAVNRLESETLPGLAASSFTYDQDGRLSKVSRTAPVGTNQTPTSSVETVVYGVPSTGSNLPTMTPGSVRGWGQSDDLPLLDNAVAVFPPHRVPTSTNATSQGGVAGIGSSEWPDAQLHYLDVNGREVNSAAYGRNQWLISSTQFDKSGNAVWSLSPKNRLAAMQKTATSSYVNGLTDVNARANLLASTSTYDATDPSKLIETFGPTRSVGLGMMSSVYVDGRDHTKTIYDEGAPNANVNPLTKKAYGLPTTVISDVYRPDASQYTTEPDADITHLGYDAVGSMAAASISGWSLGLATTSVVQMGATPSAADLTTRTVYDADGRMVEVRLPGDPDGTTPRTTKTVYYTVSGAAPCGSAIWAGMPCTTSPGGQPATGKPLATTTYTYNDYDDVVTARAKYGTTSVLRTATATYDSAQRTTKTAITVTGATTSVLPDTTVAYSPTTGLPTTVGTTDGTTQTTLQTTYDNAGRVRTYTDATGNVATTSYDIDGRPIDVTDSASSRTWSYETTAEKRGLPTSTTTTVGTTSAATFSGTYDGDGNLATQTYPGGMTAATSYLQNGSPYLLSYTKSGQPWLKFNQAIGLGSRVTRITNTLGSAATSNQAYAYDHAGRLTTVTDKVNGACATRLYAFDSHSNRTQLKTYPATTSCSTTTTPTVADYTYDAADRLTTDTAGTTTWDQLGRASALPAGDAGSNGPAATSGDLAIGYYENDLVRSQTQGTSSTTIDLDPLASRASKRTTTTQTGSTATTATTIEHYNGNSDSPAWTELSASKKTVYARGMDGAVAAIIDVDGSTTTVRLQLANPHGDLVATSTPSATTIPTDYHETTEYGIPRDAATASPNYGWLGTKQRSGDTLGGTILMGVRLYNPQTGTFASTDPVYGGNANAYSYPSDPINQFDLDGKWCKWGFGTSCGPHSVKDKYGNRINLRQSRLQHLYDKHGVTYDTLVWALKRATIVEPGRGPNNYQYYLEIHGAQCNRFGFNCYDDGQRATLLISVQQSDAGDGYNWGVLTAFCPPTQGMCPPFINSPKIN